ncbi:MAG TPA: CusA/CzcA family heavy metal efflux RND transporter [Planctomycetaceae bacterium]|nr:CusA/CzcA family heavy metal efflux RND transporter [Planctomycetaceae bacterium]
MINHVIDFSLNNRFIVLLASVAILGMGFFAASTIPLDAVPDLTNVQVQVLTNSPSLGPVEVEQFITFPIENAMSGIPNVDEIRSISRFGLSAVTVAFEEGTDIYWARNLINERLLKARENIPAGMGTPELGPIATGMSEIYQFEVRAKEGSGHSLTDLRTVLDWQIAFQLRSVPGVIEVNTFGGALKTYEVQIDSSKMQNYDISLSQIIEALEQNNGNAGGGYIAHNAEQRLIRGEALVSSLDDIRTIVLESRDGTPIRISDVAKVEFAPMLRQGAVTRDGNREAVIGMVMMLMGGNSRQVVGDVKAKIAEIQKSLPKGIAIDTFYDRTELVAKTIHTVAENIGVGVLLVILTLFILLGDVRAGLIVAAAIPLSAMSALIAMRYAGVSANLMSLGAVDFGVIVDGAVVMVENCVRRATQYQKDHQGDHVPEGVFRESAKEVGKPILFAGLIVIIVFIPILSLQGMEGKMFRPMAFTFMTALSSALILSVTVMPVLASLFLARRVKQHETFVVRKLKEGYRPMLMFAMKRPFTMFLGSIVLFIGSIFLAGGFGIEFVPKLDEGDIAIQATRLPSVSLETSIEMTQAMERTLLQFPQVETVVSKTGRPEIANDPMGVYQTDIFIRIAPDAQYEDGKTKVDLIQAMQVALQRNVPGNSYSFTQPIELRVQELVAGVRSDIGLSLYGDDLGILKSKGDEIVRALSLVPGSADVAAQQIAGLSYMRVIVRRDDLARYGVNARGVLDAISTIGGLQVGQVFEGQRRFPLQVRLRPESRANAEQLLSLKIDDSQGRPIPLSQIADVITEDGPVEISRDAVRRRLLIQCNVRGRDLAGFVAEAQEVVDRDIELPAGYTLRWGGQFENLQQATQRLSIAVPVALLLIFALLYMTFNSVNLAMLIYLNVPIAATGGVLALWSRDLPFSISAGVGFIALFGIAVMNGVVLIEHVRHLRKNGDSQNDAVINGAIDRLRPVLMTALCGALGFIPMALSGSSGAEVQRPLATVVIGGLITSTALTLIVLPTIYRWFEPKQSEAEAYDKKQFEH